MRPVDDAAVCICCGEEQQQRMNEFNRFEPEATLIRRGILQSKPEKTVRRRFRPEEDGNATAFVLQAARKSLDCEEI